MWDWISDDVGGSYHEFLSKQSREFQFIMAFPRGNHPKIPLPTSVRNSWDYPFKGSAEESYMFRGSGYRDYSECGGLLRFEQDIVRSDEKHFWAV